MRLSKFYIETLREVPAEAEVISHKLMLRAGMIKKVAAGIYSYLPMGLRVIRKVENVVRKCMNEANAVELLMPAVQPAELWQESGRWGYYGKELLRFKDRHDREFCVGPTHEEVITDIVRNSIKSYKQMPVNLYQIQTKFRDEVRPRFGLMRGREFIMKDAYSFDVDNMGSENSYKAMYDAYCKIFERCGLRYKVVDADSGAIGGSFSHEFMVLADTGEDAVISCKSCQYSANVEKAIVKDEPTVNNNIELKAEKVFTLKAHTVEEVATLLKTQNINVVKTMIVVADGKLYAVLVRGDHELNLAKLKNLIGALVVELASTADIVQSTGGAVGFSGPIGLKLPIYADNAIKYMKNFVVGANEGDYHFINTNGTDFSVERYGDLRNAMPEDTCSSCGGSYELTRGIEVGHIFKLGTKYSEKLNANYLDKNGKKQTIVMGCYGIGIGRTAASAIEQNNDESGIIWPKAIAPFEVVIVPLSNNDEEVNELSEKIYIELLEKGIDVLIDDRDERAGVKLMDADLIGYPLRLAIGKKALANGCVELFVRKTKEIVTIEKDKAIDVIINYLERV